MLAGAALTVALASCSQKEEGVAVSGNPKAVTVSFANVTRSAGDKVDKDKTALYEDFYVLFTDDAGKIYKGKSADLTTDAPIYFANAAAAGDMTFHLLDNSVKKVYVIANRPMKLRPQPMRRPVSMKSKALSWLPQHSRASIPTTMPTLCSTAYANRW